VLIGLAANLCPASFTKHFGDVLGDSQFKLFQSSIQSSLKAEPISGEKRAENAEIASLKRKLVEVISNLQMERAENKRLRKLYGREDEAQQEEDHHPITTPDQAKYKLLTVITEIVKSTNIDKQTLRWLKMCHDRVTNDVVPLINRFSTHDNFVFGLATTPGKRLLSVLLLSAMYHNNDESTLMKICEEFAKRQNWLGYVAANKKSSPFLKKFQTESWSAFLIGSGLDKLKDFG
jgi:hypothetical protein